MRRLQKRIKNDFLYLLVAGLILLVRLLPRHTALWFFGNLGKVAFILLRSERKKVIRHLTIAFGNEKSAEEIRAMARQVFVELGYNGADGLRVPLLKKEKIEELVDCVGFEHLDRALAKGKGVVCVTGHIGCWELMAAVVALKGYPLYVVGKPIYDPRLDKIVVALRESAGSRNLARGSSTKEILRALAKNSLLGILIDQDTNVDSVFVNFFGRPAYTPVGPVKLAMKTGSPIVPLAIQLQENFRHRIEVKPEIPLERTGDRRKDFVVNTQKLSDYLEKTIRQKPTQWVWMHERWKTQPGSPP